MTFAAAQATVIILHESRIFPDSLPRGFDKKGSQKCIASECYAASMNSFAAFPDPWNKSDIAAQVVNMRKTVYISQFRYQDGSCQGTYTRYAC